MQIVMKKCADLVPYEKNPRKNDGAVPSVAASIEEFGFKVPIVIGKDGVIVAGHTRLKAAKKLGMAEVPCIIADDLTPEQIKAFRLADNKTGELADWDFDLLDEELADLGGIDMSLFGFDINAVTGNTDATEDDYEEPNEVTATVKRGEVYDLGGHRLMCGDSTDQGDVDTLMGGVRADLCFTSPPYNMAAAGSWQSAPNESMHFGKAYGMYKDDLGNDEYSQMLIDALGNALAHADDAMFNIGILEGSKPGIIKMLDAYASNFLDIVVWNKAQSMPHGMESQRGMLSHRCELVFCFNQKGSRSFTHPQWAKGAGINRIDTCNASGNKYAKEHAATFPVEFAFEAVKNFSADSVLDLFGGTGTTMIAAEQLGRTCYMMELDPHYCDVIIDRWEKFTGKKAVRIDA